MSNGTYRYFRSLTGQVTSVRDGSPMLRAFTEDPSRTEVQVAPLDAVVVDGPLPEVAVDGGDLTVGDYRFSPFDSLDEAAGYLRALAAVVKHYAAHPPVDEKKVDDLQDLLIEATSNRGNIDTRAIARDLLASGRVEVAS